MIVGMEQFVSTFSATGRQPKETCKQCRFRKVRCDGNHGEKGCGDCGRLKFACSFVTPSVPPTPTISAHTVTDAGACQAAQADVGADQPSPTTDSARPVERRRTSKACTHCRQHKIRCSGATPCIACKKKGTTCVYGTDRRRGSRPNLTAAGSGAGSAAGTPTESTFASAAESVTSAEDGSATSPTTPAMTTFEPVTATRPGPVAEPSLLPPEIQSLVRFYFSRVYPLPSYAFLHPQTIIRQCNEGKLEACLSYAIAAVASHHHAQGSSQARGDVELSWIQAAEDLIWRHLESPTVTRLQALLLIVLYRVETGAFQRAFMLSALAARAAAAMRLNHERTGLQCNVQKLGQEVRRRVMWSLKLVERYFSTGLPEFELCPVESLYLELPCWERDFSRLPDNSSDPGGILQSCDLGSYHLCLKQEMLRRDLMKLTRSLALCDAPFPQLPSLMHDFEQHLERIGRELPNGPRLTTDRISQLLDSPWLPRQILVHLSFHQCQCDLYRLLLRNYREAAPAAVLDVMDQSLLAKAEGLCLKHATAIVDILATLNQQSQRALLLEFDTAICGYHATRLLLFIAQFSRAPTRPSEEWALSRAELCLAALRRFFPTSKLVRPVLEEMMRLISAFSSRSTATPSRLASPGPTTNGNRGASIALSDAARVRQRLAIHSLLRQADFTDDDDDDHHHHHHHHQQQQQQQQHEETKGGSSSHTQALTPPSGTGTGTGTGMARAPCPSPASTHAGAPGVAGLEIPGTPSSSSHNSPPKATPDGDPWQLRWLGNGDFANKWSPEVQPQPASGGGSPSFSFPWLKRWDSSLVINGGMED